jgi:hypothetical protein
MSWSITRGSVRQCRTTCVLLAWMLCLDALMPTAFAAGAVPTIASFTATPTRVLVGRSAALRWSVSGATRVAISHGVGVVTGKTEVSVRPPSTTRYFISAWNANGSVTKAVVVSVTTGTTPTPPPPTPPPPPQPPLPPSSAAICPAPIPPADTSTVIARVGSGTPQSCTESVLRAEVAKGGTITFNCGAEAATIRVTQTIQVPTDRDTVIDGGNKVTFDGNRAVRILNMTQGNYRTNRRGLTLQRIALINGSARESGYVAPNPNYPKCAYGYAQGSGGAIQVRDARLHVFDVEFRNNAAATPGPDVGGGAIYALGALDVTITGSRFINNIGSNAGAVGLLQSNATSTTAASKATRLQVSDRTMSRAISVPALGTRGRAVPAAMAAQLRSMVATIRIKSSAAPSS